MVISTRGGVRLLVGCLCSLLLEWFQPGSVYKSGNKLDHVLWVLAFIPKTYLMYLKICRHPKTVFSIHVKVYSGRGRQVDTNGRRTRKSLIGPNEKWLYSQYLCKNRAMDKFSKYHGDHPSSCTRKLMSTQRPRPEYTLSGIRWFAKQNLSFHQLFIIVQIEITNKMSQNE